MRYIVSILTIVSLWVAPLAFGQVLPSTPGSVTTPVIQFNANGFGYQYTPGGGSTKFYDHGNGITGYTSKDSMGRVISQGTIYDAIQKDRAMDPIGIPPPASHSLGRSDLPSLQGSEFFPR